MTEQQRIWIFIVDERGGRLLRGRPMPERHYHFDLEDSLCNTWEAHEHGRPSPLAPAAGYTFAAPGHEDETMRQRFASDVVLWLEDRVRRLHIDRVAVLAPPRLLGVLRALWPHGLQEHVEEYEENLTGLPMKRLLDHPLIVRLTNTAAAAAPA